MNTSCREGLLQRRAITATPLASCFVYRCVRLRQSVGKGPLRSFNGKPRDECLGGEIFYSLKERAVVIEQWRNDYGPIGRIHR